MVKRLAIQLSATDIKITTDRVRSLMSNACIDLPRYSSGEFRYQQIKEAKHLLSLLEAQLAAQAAVEMAMRV